MTLSRYSKLILYARTLCYLRPRQVLGRLKRHIRFRPIPPEVAPPLNREVLDRILGYSEMRAACLGGEAPSPPTQATFLGISASLEYGAPWLDATRPMLWRYQLHGFRHLDDVLRPDNRDPSYFLEAVKSWIVANPAACRPAWDPYPTSGRLMRWCAAEACFRFNDTEMGRSMRQQATWLRKNIEFDVDANHLLKNIVALAVYGALADTELLNSTIKMLEKALAEQVLPDGCHYERSPMYHVQVLEDLLFLNAALEQPPDFLVETLKKMVGALETLLHPDGEIALFGDAVLGETLPTDVLQEIARKCLDIETAKTEVSTSLPNAGYYVLRPKDGQHHLIVKASEPGVHYQLGHAHCDPLSFELSVGGQRIIVDSGTHGYAESPYREYCRSVRAHNTVCVNNQEPLETWHVFRMARRYQFDNAVFDPRQLTLNAAYRAYQGYKHSRVFSWNEDGFWNVRDEITGSGTISTESYLHFHPDCEVKKSENGEWTVCRGQHHLVIRCIGNSSTELVCGVESPHQGWYSPRFGEARPAPVLIHHCQGTGKLLFGFDIVSAQQ